MFKLKSFTFYSWGGKIYPGIQVSNYTDSILCIQVSNYTDSIFVSRYQNKMIIFSISRYLNILKFTASWYPNILIELSVSRYLYTASIDCIQVSIYSDSTLCIFPFPPPAPDPPDLGYIEPGSPGYRLY